MSRSLWDIEREIGRSPFGLHGDEPFAFVDTFMQGLCPGLTYGTREGFALGFFTEAQARERWPEVGDRLLLTDRELEWAKRVRPLLDEHDRLCGVETTPKESA